MYAVIDVVNVNNIYQLLAFLIVAGLQIYTQRGVGKLAGVQANIKEEIEAARVEMFRLANLSGAHITRTEDSTEGIVDTFEAVLKVAYLQGKVDAVKSDVPYPRERFVSSARKMVKLAIHGYELTPAEKAIVQANDSKPGDTIQS